MLLVLISLIITIEDFLLCMWASLSQRMTEKRNQRVWEAMVMIVGGGGVGFCSFGMNDTSILLF